MTEEQFEKVIEELRRWFDRAEFVMAECERPEVELEPEPGDILPRWKLADVCTFTIRFAGLEK